VLAVLPLLGALGLVRSIRADRRDPGALTP
jgi:hypothetical protein